MHKSKKIAVVTGASSGIGEAVAIMFAKQNYHVILVAKSQTKLSLVQNRIRKNGDTASTYSLDVADHEAVDDCVADVIKKNKKIDVLFNNAGIAGIGTSEIGIEQLQSLININLLGAIYFANAVAKHMKKKRGGYIFNLASIAGYEKGVNALMGGYVASKFGLVGYSHALHNELLQYQVKVTTISPSIINTAMVRNQGLEFSYEKFIQPEDIAKVVINLLDYSWNMHIREIVIECPIEREFSEKFCKVYRARSLLGNSIKAFKRDESKAT